MAMRRGLGHPMSRGGEMKTRDILEFVKVEHTLFSLPFILMGYTLAWREYRVPEVLPYYSIDLLLILIAAVGARGLAMTLNRIIDRNIDAANPRTADRHLASGKMSLPTAWLIAVIFLAMLLVSSWHLNEVAFKMSWLPVLAFLVYPYLKRFTWACHFWLGFCLGLAPAGAWVAVTADYHGWAAITGLHETHTEFLWYPEILAISLSVMVWISAFDLQYARMDIDSDRKHGVNSFPSRFGVERTYYLTFFLTITWVALLLASGLHGFSDGDFRAWYRFPFWIHAVFLTGLLNALVIQRNKGELDEDEMKSFQKLWFYVSAATGWILYFSLIWVEYTNSGLMD